MVWNLSQRLLKVVDFRAAILVVVLACVSAIIYFPFFKVYEKQLLAQEAEEAQRMAEESQQTA